MTSALALLTHALRMLVADIGSTIRVILPALICVMGAALAAVVLAGDTLALIQAAPDDMPVPDGGQVLIVMLCGLIGLAGYVLLAILWHRHVLLNGPDRDAGLRPDASLFWGYVWRTIVLGFAQFLIAIPIVIAVGVLGAVSGGSMAGLVLLGLVAGIVFLWVALRLSLVLPAAALGHTMRLRESWEATAPAAQALWGLAVLLALVNGVLTLLSGALLAEAASARLILDSALYIIEGLVFISVLTTLYGHLVQGRTLG
tara:strand:- start:125263 stop:126036 length:774 start_codon:yes stop_codon:yes gene_type:complete